MRKDTCTSEMALPSGGSTPTHPPAAAPRREHHGAGLSCAGLVLVRVQLALDPSVEVPAAARRAAVTPAPAASTTTAPAPEVRFEPAPKTAIPDRFLTPWEIQFTR